MKRTRSFLVTFLSISLVFASFLSLAIQSVSAQDSGIAIQRGYRTGYSDGYMSGYRDVIDNAAKSYDKHSEYAKADRAYNKDYGALEDYRDGYQQGFETGYNTGFEKRSFDATIPAGLNKRGIVAVKTTVETPAAQTTVSENNSVNAATEPVADNRAEEQVIVTAPTEAVVDAANTTAITAPTTAVANTDEQPPLMTNKTERAVLTINDGTTMLIPTDTELIVELLNDISTEQSREGDKFTARVISPNEIGGAIIEGRVSKIQKPGRIKRRSEVLLSFDRIVLTDSRWSNFNALLTEVLPTKGDNVKRVDIEGTVEGRSSVKDDSIKIGATTGTGLIIGAIAGGPVGAAVGAAVGAGVGVGAVVVERGKHIRLNKNQQLRIKSAYDTQIR
ncbi:MAG: hypothetical protein H0V31_09065 [Acidobacteria bacterium]|nr:hypothetical protein [Acidobacteriota bacterium]